MDYESLESHEWDHRANQWFENNPLILGLVVCALGAAIVARGGWALYTGVSRDQYGRVTKGNLGKAASILLLTFGASLSLFGLYKMIVGLVF